MNTHTRKFYFMLGALIIGLLVSACQSALSTDNIASAVNLSKQTNSQFADSCTALIQAIDGRIGEARDGFAQSVRGAENYTNFDPDGNIIADQVVISGDINEIDSAINAVGASAQQLFEIPLYDPSNVMTAVGAVRLYQLDGSIDIYSFIHQFNEIAIQQTNGQITTDTALAEPNLIVYGPESPFAENTGGSGGKSTVLGSGGKSTVLGSGGDSLLPIGMDSRDSANAYANQWGFTQIQLTDNGQRRVSQTGNGVNIVVFDTSPYEKSGLLNAEWTEDSFTFCNLSLIDSYGRAMEPNDTSEKLQNHGLFVSGLAHAVAPESRVHIMQVLNDDMTGNVFTLLNGIDLYAQGQQETTGPQKTVFNMSLVISPARDFLFSEKDEPSARAFEAFEDQLKSLGCPATSIAMCRSMGRYSGMGYVMTAAAGNFNLTETQYPASDARVIGVSGSTEDGSKGCFSNAGEVAAPAGNAFYDASKQTCDLRLDQYCPAGEPCDRDGIRMIISLAEPRTGYDNGYAQWIGTSFAAPQVAGLAALSFEAQPAAKDFAGLQSGAQAVSTAVISNAQHILQPPEDGLGAGIIHSVNTLP